MSVPWYLMAKGKGGGGYKTASGPIVSISDAVAAPLRSLRVGIDPVQSGTGDPSPDNVRPISGWSEVNVWRTGKNLYPVKIGADSWSNFNNGSATNNDGELVVSMASQMYSGVFSRARLSEARKLATIPTVASYSAMIKASESTEIFFGYSKAGNQKFQLTTSYQRFTFNNFTFGDDQSLNIYNGTANAVTIYVKDFQFELGSTATAYEPYSGNQYTIQLGDTVYGGNLDVTSGVLTVDRAMVDMGTLAFYKTSSPSASGGSVFGVLLADVGLGMATRERYAPNTMLSDTFATAKASIWWESDIQDLTATVSGVSLYVADSRYTDAASFKAAVSGVQLCYELATPFTVQLTPTQISTLQGQNNVWADTGGVTLEYLSSGGANADLMKLAVAFMGRK